MALSTGSIVQAADVVPKTGGTFTGAISAKGIRCDMQDTTHEGGEIMFEAPTSSSYNYYAAMDVRDNMFRVHSNSGDMFKINLDNAKWTLTGGLGDYAENEKTDITEAGRCVSMKEDQIMHQTTERLESNCGIISDTAGLVIGDEGGSAISLAGYVLAYPYQDKQNYKIGDCVCSAPNGTVDIMTREEICNYPDRIVGIVTVLPKNKKMDIVDNARIWIKVQ